MAIDKLDSVPDPQLNKILDGIHDKAVGVVYRDSAPSATQVPWGKLTIYDNGATRECYIRTGKDTAVKWTLSAV